jgi:hypothetical protein
MESLKKKRLSAAWEVGASVWAPHMESLKK